MSNLKKKPYKIVFGSGQTLVGVSTLLKSFLEGWTPSQNENYLATIDYERKELEYSNIKFEIFDLGNQTAFLDRFVGELSEFIFSGVRVLVFVVDPIDIRALNRVRFYFEKMISHLNTYSPKAKVFVFFNKWDLVPKNLVEELYNEIRSYLFEAIDPSYQQSNIRIYKTSVFGKTLTKPMLDVFSTTLTGEFL
ncbi:MAG: ADP-ribosylation factor-like protein [Candidatus Hodarchaeota archaeon]